MGVDVPDGSQLRSTSRSILGYDFEGVHLVQEWISRKAESGVG